jgi:hypothetical protein
MPSMHLEAVWGGFLIYLPQNHPIQAIKGGGHPLTNHPFIKEETQYKRAQCSKKRRRATLLS